MTDKPQAKNAPSQPVPVSSAKHARQVLYFCQNPDENFNFLRYLQGVGIQTHKYSDAKSFIQKFKNEIPASCVLDLDSKLVNETKALLKSLRTVYGKGILIFGVSNTDSNELIEFATGNAITAVLKKNLEIKEFQEIFVSKLSKYEKQDLTKRTPLPTIIEWYFEKITQPLSIVYTNIERHELLEEKIKFYEERLLPYREFYVPMVKSLSKSAEEIHFTQAVRLYGVSPNKTLLTAFTLAEALKSEALKWNEKSNMPTVDPKAFIPYALKTLQTFGEDSRYAEPAFNVGLLFDFFHHMNEVSPQKNPALKKYIETRHEQALTKSKEAYKKAVNIKDLSYEKHVLTYFMMKEIGRIAMATYYPDYIDFSNALEKANLKVIMTALAEKKKYFIAHTLIGAMLTQVVPGCAEAAQSIRYAGQKYLLNNDAHDHNTFTLVAFCS